MAVAAPSLAAALAALILAASSPLSCPPCLAFAPPSRPPEPVRARGCPPLAMGIRSFVKRKILGKGEQSKDDADGDGDGDGDKGGVTLRGILRSQSPAGTTESSAPSGGNFSLLGGGGKKAKAEKEAAVPAEASAADRALYEGTRERIQRMKGGGMTTDEKAAFLKNALSPGKPRPMVEARSPPIRQKIPGMEGMMRRGGKGKGKAGDKGGLMSAVKGKSSEQSPVNMASLMMNGKMKSEEAKQRYMDSVTNPARFSSFSSYIPPEEVEDEDEEDDEEENEDEDGEETEGVAEEQGVASAGNVEGEESGGEEAGGEAEGGGKKEDVAKEETLLEVKAEEAAPVETTPVEVSAAGSTDFAQMRRQIANDRALLDQRRPPEQSAARDAVESILSMIGTRGKDGEGEGAAAAAQADLGARLEQAAVIQETREADGRRAAVQRAEREAAQARANERLAREAREEELRRRELERAEKARHEEQRRRQEEQERAAREQEELEARQAAQVGDLQRQGGQGTEDGGRGRRPLVEGRVAGDRQAAERPCATTGTAPFRPLAVAVPKQSRCDNSANRGFRLSRRRLRKATGPSVARWTAQFTRNQHMSARAQLPPRAECRPWALPLVNECEFKHPRVLVLSKAARLLVDRGMGDAMT